MKRIIIWLGVFVLIVSSVSVYGSQEKKEPETIHTEERVNEAQNTYGYGDENAAEVKTGRDDSNELNDQGNMDMAEPHDDVEEEAEAVEIEQDSSAEDDTTEQEPIIETEEEPDQEEPVAEEPIIEEPVEEDTPVEPEPSSADQKEPSAFMGSFSEIFIKEKIRVVENPDTVEEFEAILLHMCETNTFTYSMEYYGVSFDELLTDETQREIATAFDSIFNKYPEYMSFTNRMTYKAKGGSDKVTLTLTLSSDTGMDEETLIRYREAFFEESMEIVGELEASGLLYNGQSDRGKALVLFDWIVRNTEYDNDFHAESYTGYGIYENGLGVCQGYTAAYNALSKCAGLRVEGVGGVADGVDHIWTRALFAGEDVFIDSTWGDSYTNSDKSNYDYFLVDGDTLAASHTW